MSFFSPSSGPHVEDIARENKIKLNITDNLQSALKALQKENISTEKPIGSTESANAVCSIIEAVFIHGLKTPANDKNFWRLLTKFTHKDVITELLHLGQINTDVGLCRAWLRVAINEGLLESYVDAMIADISTLRAFYKRTAYLRDLEQPGIFKTLVRCLSELYFQLPYNSSVLNIWTNTPLQLAGLVDVQSTPSAVVRVRPGTVTKTGVSTGSTVRSSGSSSKWPISQARTTADRGNAVEPRIVSPVTYEWLSGRQVPVPPPNTPYDPSVLTQADIEEIRKLARSDRSDDNSSTATSQLSHPDSTDAREFPQDSIVIEHKPIKHKHVVKVKHKPNSETKTNPHTDDHRTDFSTTEKSPKDANLSPNSCEQSSKDEKQSPNNITVLKAEENESADKDRKDEMSGSKDLQTEDISQEEKEPKKNLQQETEIQPKSDEDATTSATASDPTPIKETSAAEHRSISRMFPDLKSLSKSPPLEPELSSVTATCSRVEVGTEIIGRNPFEDDDDDDEEKDEVEIIDDELNPFLVSGASPPGNSLGNKQGWSSDFDSSIEAQLCREDIMTRSERASFDTVLQHNDPGPVAVPSLSLILDGLPADGTPPDTETVDQEGIDSDLAQSFGVEAMEEYDIVYEPQESLNDPKMQTFLENLDVICNEKGLDSQNFKCASCSRQIGMFCGKPRVCVYDGCYYCYECHENEEAYVPSRIIYNWDFRKHQVCKQNLEKLRRVEDLPLINVQSLNPKLYDHVPQMMEVLTLRRQLRFLKAYLFTCKQSVADDLRRQVWPKEYLYDDIHLYSLLDLLQVPPGYIAQSVKKAIKFASNHVYNCRLCSQKGFLCEICKNPKVIYPFEIESTYRCPRCETVYHQDCKTDLIPCPKCKRRQSRSTRLSVDLSPDSPDYSFSPTDTGPTVSGSSSVDSNNLHSR